MSSILPTKAGDIRHAFTNASVETRDLVWDLWMNHMFVEGKQWFNRVPDTDQLINGVDEETFQVTDNLMQPNHRTLMGLINQQRTKYENTPQRYTPDSIRGSIVARRLINRISDAHEWEAMKRQLSVAVLQGGTAALSIDYNPDTADTYESVLTIADFVLEPGVRSVREANWWIRLQLLPPKVVQRMYGLKKEPPASNHSGISHLISINNGLRSQTQPGNLCLVYTYYERPHGKNPGRVIVEAGGEWIEVNKWEFPFDHLNVVLAVDIDHPMSPYGSTAYTSARSMQVARNMAVTQLSEHLDRTATTPLIAAMSGSMHLENRDGIPGEVIRWPDGVSLPMYMEPPNLPGWMQNLPGMYGESVDGQMSVHDVTRGEAPVNLESAAAIQTLANMDGTPTSMIIYSITYAFNRIAQMALQILVAKNSNVHSPTFDGNFTLPIGDVGEEWHVKIPRDTQVPRTPAARMQEAMVLLQMGVIKTLDEYSKILSTPEMERAVESMQPDVAKARFENEMSREGNIPPPERFDEHGIHIEEHNRARKSIDWWILTEEQKEEMNLHIEGHKQFAAEQAAEAIGQMEQDPSGTLQQAPTQDGPAPEIPHPEQLMPEAPLTESAPPQGPPLPQEEPAPVEEFDPDLAADNIESIFS